MLDLKTESLTKKLASTRDESVGDTSGVTLASSKASSQAASCGSGDRVGVASWDGIHGVGVCALVGGGCAAIVVGSSVATCRPALLLSAMVGAALCSVVIVGGSFRVRGGESTGVGGGGDD